MITGNDYEYAPKLIPDKCHRLFWIATTGYECKREADHGGSCTFDGVTLLDQRTKMVFTVSWRQEPIA